MSKLSGPEMIKFLNENYAKEQILRLKWARNNVDRLKKAGQLTREPKDYTESIIKEHIVVEGLQALTRDYITDSRNKRTKPLLDIKQMRLGDEMRHDHNIVTFGLGDPKEDPRLLHSDYEYDPIMRPVNKKVKDIIYMSSPMRKVYLKERNKIDPEKKYYFAECDSWEYGWRFKDTNLVPCARLGKVFVMERARDRSGPQPSPRDQSNVAKEFDKCATS